MTSFNNHTQQVGFESNVIQALQTPRRTNQDQSDIIYAYQSVLKQLCLIQKYSFLG